MAFRKKYRYKKASGSFSKKKTPTNLQAQINTLAKVVKKDHKILAKAVDYTDYLYPEIISVVSYKMWNYASLIIPNMWVSTCRRSNSTTIQPEAVLKEMNLSFCCNHGLSNYETTWYVAVVRAKKDWVPNTAVPSENLRNYVDFTDMGAGNAPILNYDKFSVLKSWTFSTTLISQGNPVTSTQRRFHKFKLNQAMKSSPTTIGTSDQNWIGNFESDFDTQDRLYVIHYANTPANAAWGTSYNPSITVGVRFTVCTV